MPTKISMSFHLGKPILVMLLLSLLCAAALALRTSEHHRPDLLLWVFNPQHLKTYTDNSAAPSLIQQFENAHDTTVGIELIGTRAEDIRLASMFMSDSKDVPDLVEIEIGSIGKYFRPPTSDIGLLPLNGFLKESGLLDKILPARLTLWSKDGQIFGVPHDVHPVAIAYRADLFEEAGIDLPAAKTWPEFRAACLAFQTYWQAHGAQNRHAIELQNSSADHLIPMLLQRHLNPIQPNGQVTITSEKFVETLAFYIECVAGPTNIAAQSSATAGGLYSDLRDANICALFTPDWRIDDLKQNAPELAGKMRLMPLPIFEKSDAATATWGGTMIGIPKNSKHPEEAWKLLEFLYFSQQGIQARQKFSNILPPVTTVWDDPAYQRPDPYFAGQKIDQLYIDLTRQIPTRCVTPASALASGYLSRVIMNGSAFVQSHPSDHAALVAACKSWLTDIQQDLQRRIEHGKFDE
jgi:arabinosaccharide transport system substrate-binding protein